MDTLEGRQLGQYRIDKEIGRGSMGAVYRAYAVANPQQAVAIKILLAALSADNSFITRFTRETEALRKMRHPHIVRILDAGQDRSMLYYVMEFINGTTAGTLLKQRGKITVPQAVEVGAQVADALDYVHETGQLIHRDIKPDNVMVDRWYSAKLLDFGLARIDGAYTITRAGMVVGSLYYVPSEQLRGEKIDGRADIYALGVSLYEMVTGERPFRGKNLQEMTRAIAAGNPIPPSILEPTVSHELERIILKALARRREDRYARASEMRDELRWLQSTANGGAANGPATQVLPQTPAAPYPNTPQVSQMSHPGSPPLTSHPGMPRPPDAAPLPRFTRPTHASAPSPEPRPPLPRDNHHR